MPLIRLDNIYKTYQVGEIEVPVLKGVSLSIERGELVALMGASGSGKSTLMNILGLLDRPTSGRYWLDGEDVSQLPPDRRALVRTAKLGFVFQSFNLLPRTTAVSNVLMPLDYSTTRRNASESIARTHQLLERVGLQDRIHHVPSQMSGGQQQRVAIARSLVNQPALLLADEPTGNLDSHTSVEILEMFQQLNASGLTVILVTHDPKVANYAHRTIRMVDGVIEQDTAQASSAKSSSALPAPHLLRSGARTTNGNGDDKPEHDHPEHNNPEHNGNSWTEPATQPADSGGNGSALATRTETKRKRRLASAMQSEAVSESPVTESAVSEPVEKVRLSLGERISALMPATLRTAFGALRRNLMRSALTTLGIIIGVGAVIAMVEISDGSRTELMKTMSSMGSNVLIVANGAAASGGVNWGSGTEEMLTPDDAAEISRQCPAVAEAAPIVSAGGQVVYGNRNWVPMRITGSTPGYLVVRDWNNMDEGEMFTDRDVLSANRVCVIGTTLARELFQGESPIGKDIRLKNVSLRVVGVLGRKGATMMGDDQDDIVLAPWSTIKYRISGARTASAKAAATAGSSGLEKLNSLQNPYPGTVALYPVQSAVQKANTPQNVRLDTVDVILVKGVSSSRTKEALNEITALLHERHRIRDDQEDDFTVRDMADIIAAMSSMSKMMGGLLLILAMISLAVGGVGIMNIMLVSVTERTREIGLRMAVGARSYHILRQFLIEAVVLCLFGGAMGIVLGRAASILVWYFMRWPIQASMMAILAAFAVSAGVGIAFGFYPAWKASRLDPIEALRYE